MLNLYGETDGHLGIVRMNREHRYNTLTSALISDIQRGVDTMDQDSLLHAIYLGTEEGKHWSNGTDFRTIAHMKKEDSYSRIKEYIEQLYNIQIKLASCNKPLIAVAPGHSMNSGAALLAAASHPLATLDSKIAFNEVTFGFVPHAGATYYLSRLQGEFGTFMALTGMSIHGTDAARVDIARGIVHDPINYVEDVAEVVSAMPYPEFGGDQLFETNQNIVTQKPTQWQYYAKERQNQIFKLDNDEAMKLYRQKKNLDWRDEFSEPHERIPSSTAEAEYRYMQLLKNDAQKFDGYENEPSMLEFGQSEKFLYKNYFKDTLGWINQHIENDYPHHKGVAVNHSQLIDRCFFSNSVEEIMENLSKENHPFATECLEAMKRNCPVSMQLALLMVRKAANLDYKGCLQMEINVAFNRIQDSDFDLGVKEVLGAPKAKGAKHKQAPNWQKLAQINTLDRYFDESKWANLVKLKVVENALLPTKHYYDRFTDQVRLWLNETSATQEKIRERFDDEAKNALMEQGIDVRDKALTPEIARKHMRGKLAQERCSEVFNERSQQLMTDQKLRENYFGQIQSQVEKLEGDKNLFYEKVNQNVAQIFENGYLDRLDQIFKKSQKVHNLEKRRMFIRLKKFYFKSRILAYGDEQIKRQIKQLQSLPFQQIHMTEKWDESFRNGNHPDLIRTPLYYLSQAIGRISLTEPELAKSYLTQPENRGQMTMFTLSKTELEKLQTDVYENPEKYEMIFVGNTVPEIDNHFQKKNERDLLLEKFEERSYWYRLLNNQFCPSDSKLPFFNEFTAYKEWADTVEYNALNTLKFAINKLLIDMEDTHADDSKIGNLKKLVMKINREPAQKRANKNNQTKDTIGIQERPLNEIRSSIQQMLKNDPNLGHLFEEKETKFAKVQALKKDFEQELVRLVEIILLNKYSNHFDSPEIKKSMEQRFASLSNPKQSIRQSLNLIDQFLHQKNGEALVKDAFDLAAPFFFQMMQKKLKEEAQLLIKELQFQKYQQQFLIYYYFNNQYPNAKKNSTLQRLINYSHDREIAEQVNVVFPTLSAAFQKREILSLLGGEPIGVKGQSLSYIKKEAIQQTRQELNHLETFDKNASKPKNFKKSDQETRDKHLQISEFEHNELYQMSQDLQNVVEWLFDNKYELDHHLTDLDMLFLCSESINKYQLDMLKLTESGDQKQWENAAAAAKFIVELASGLDKVIKEKDFDAFQFLEQNKLKNNGELNLDAFYSSALEEREKVRDQKKNVIVADRHNIIKNEIKDFNLLQQKIQESKNSEQQLQRLISNKSRQIQDSLSQFITNNDFVDFQKMVQMVEIDDYSFIEQPAKVTNIENVIKNVKSSHNNSKDLLHSSVDVISLHNLKNKLISDPEIQQQAKQQLIQTINYVCDETKYLSNDDRKNITVKDYLEKHHFNSPEAQSLYSSDLLKHKLEQILGKTDQTEPDFIDWEIGQTRTMPTEHSKPVSDYDLLGIADDVIDESQGNEQQKQEKKQKQNYETDTMNQVQFVNPVTGIVEEHSVRQYENLQVLRLAQELSELPLQMKATKNLYEHKLLLQMMEPEFSDQKLNEVIEEYTQIRLKGLLLNKQFAKHLQSENAHLFLKVLKEQIVVELGLTDPPKGAELSYQNVTEEFNNQQFFELENVYNFQSINNANALGYDNMFERSKTNTAEENLKLAHENVFDKLLADYFLDKRGEYKESNKLLKQLSSIFEDQQAKNWELDGTPHLDQTHLRQSVNKAKDPVIPASAFRELIQLDVVTSRAMQHSKNGLSDSLRKLSIDETEHEDYFKSQIPEYFELFDVRKPAEKYVEDKLTQVINECFQVRAKIEKSMTRNELQAFDKVLARYLQKDKLMPNLKKSIERDYNALHQNRTLFHAAELNQDNLETQGLKEINKQRDYNKRIKNEDAEFKLLAFNAIQERKNKLASENKDDYDAAFNENSFEEFYRGQLREDAQKEPRPINPADYLPRKPWDRPTDSKFKSRKQRLEDLWFDHSIYLEKKKEQQDRIQLFYIFEQFFEQQRRKPDPNSKGQNEIREYFADPENTFFFDKNKLV